MTSLPRHITVSVGLLSVLATCLILAPEISVAQVPAAPSNVRLRVVRDNAIDVFWQDNSNNEVAFDIFRRAAGGPASLLTAVDANITVFQDRNSGIRPNIQYCYRVDARNGAGSASSPESCVTVPPRPNPPSDLQLSRENATSPLNLNWVDNSGNETEFLIWRDTLGTAAAFALYDTVDANVTTYSDFILKPTGTYCYFVSAINASGESPGTEPECTEIGNVPAPPIRTTAETLSDTGIFVGWEFEVISYEMLFVERSADNQMTWADVFQTDRVLNEFTDQGLTPNTEYCYRIRVEGSTGTPAFSPVSCSATSFAVPDAPTGVLAEGLQAGVIQLTWQAVTSSRILYRVERSSGGAAFELAADSLSVTSFEDSDRDAALVHCYRVRAFNPEFESDWSETDCAIIVPDPVMSLAAVPNPADPIRQVVVSWQLGSDVAGTSYEVSYREASDGAFSDPIEVFGNETTISGLSDATLYEFSVVALRVIDTESARSAAVSTTARTYLSFWPGDVNADGSVTADDVVALTAPACFGQTTGFSTDGLSVAWAEIAVQVTEKDAGPLRCDTDRSGLVDVFDFLAIAANAGRVTAKGANTTSSQIVDAAHRARIESIFESFHPESEAQSELKDDQGEILNKSIVDLPDRLALNSIYPNPARHAVSALVELPEETRVSLAVVNTAGQMVRSVIEESTITAGRHTVRLDLESLAPGLYFIVLDADGRRLSRSVAVIR